MLAIYTALIGKKSELKPAKWISKDVEYFCFTDQAAEEIPKPWKVIKVERQFDDPVRDAKIYKMFPNRYLKEFDKTIWIDANFEIVQDLSELVKMLDDNDMVIFRHFERYCLYDEAEVVKMRNLDNTNIVISQMERYKLDNYPTKNGLAECGIILRNNNSDKVNEFNEKWWNEICNGSRRDQLSFMYVVWKTNIKLKKIDYTSRKDPRFIWHPHLKQNMEI